MLGPVVVLALLAPMCLADPRDPCSAESSVSDVRFTLALKGGQSVFHEGEIIPLRLAFSTVSIRYFVNTFHDERSGRFGIDLFCVEPEGIDPFRNYLQGGSLESGEISELKLAAGPFATEEYLNEWRRLPPGHYRLYAVSRRISRLQEPGETAESGHISVPLRSNTVEFDVQPADKVWLDQQLSTAVAALASHAQTEDAKHAARVLRYLGTRESIQALLTFAEVNQRQPGRSDLLMGLLSSPFPDLAVEAMHAEFVVPNYAIDAEFLRTLCLLQLESGPSDSWLRQEAHYKVLMHDEVIHLASVLSLKSEPARAITLNAMLASIDVDPALVRTIRPALIASWKDLSPEIQEQMIVRSWQIFNTPEMLPVLRSIVSDTPARSQSPQLRNAALKHIYELDPSEGRAFILLDLYNASATPDPENVRLLTLDQIQAGVPAAITRITNGTAHALDYELVDRYGDASAIGPAQAAYDSLAKATDCDSRGHLVRFLLRVSPELGVDQVRASLADRTTRCYKFLLQNLDDELPRAEKVAIESLNDPDAQVVASAVLALGRWGDAEAEAPLWSRLERFHEEWKSRAAEVVFNIGGDTPGQHAFHLEQELEVALLSGRGWLCPPEKLARLSDLALSDFNRDQIKLDIAKWQSQPFDIDTAWVPGQEPAFYVLSYADMTEKQLRAKLAQFPRGTRFVYTVWTPARSHPPLSVSMQEAAFQRIRAFAESRGLVVAEKLN